MAKSIFCGIYAMFLLSIVLVSSCAVSKKGIPDSKIEKEVTHVYSNLAFVPPTIQKNISGNILLIVTPIDAKSIDKETLEAAERDGSYEKELATIIEMEKVQANKYEKSLIGAKERATKSIKSLLSQGHISQNAAIMMIRRIWQGSRAGVIGTEVSSFTEIETFYNANNPFNVNDKYLSVFKLTFENIGKDIEKVNLSGFQIISDEEQLYPLTTKYFEDNFKSEPEKVKNAYRMNMPDELTLTPNQRIVKYISIPAINPSKDKLSVQFVRENKVVDYNFIVEDKSLVKSYVLEPYYFYPAQGTFDNRINYIFVIEVENGPTLATKSEIFYNRKDFPFKVYSISYSEYFEKVRFGTIEKRSQDKFKNNRIGIKYSNVE